MIQVGKKRRNGHAKLWFIDKDGSFRLKGAENDRELYFPIAGEHGLKSDITPNLCGDAKLDQNHFLLEPQSVGDLAQKRTSRISGV